MMIVQSGPSTRVPVPTSTAPFQYVQNTAAVLGVIPQLETEWARIPADIRAEFTGWYLDALGALNRYTHRIGDSDWYTTGEGYWPGAEPNRGLYGAAVATDVMLTYNRVVLAHTRLDGVVHEFGHHLDAVFRRVRGLDATWLPNSSLRFHAPFVTLWPAVKDRIPASMYGARNPSEWIAELWTYLILDDPLTFVQLMGYDPVAAETMRAAWVAMFPVLEDRAPADWLAGLAPQVPNAQRVIDYYAGVRPKVGTQAWLSAAFPPLEVVRNVEVLGGLPPGLLLSVPEANGWNRIGLSISGVPSAAGTYVVRLRVTPDSTFDPIEFSVSITVVP